MTPIRKRPEIILLADLAADLYRDDYHVLAMLALLRNGHPRASSVGAGGDTSDPSTWADISEDDTDYAPYPDPTGEWAIRPDEAHQLGRAYSRHMTSALNALQAADYIRRQMIPPDVNRKDIADPDQWCRNCLPHGYCEPRTKDGGQYCKWCRNCRHQFGFLPPEHILHLHHAGERAKVGKALQAHAKSAKKKR